MTEFEYEDRITITTPEGVELSLTLAGVGSRFIAATVDAAIEAILLVALGLLVFLSNGFGAGENAAVAMYVVAGFLLFWGYDVAFEVLASGRTPGKRWNGLRVVLVGGQPIGFLASAVRNLLRLIDWLPSLYLVGIVSIFVTQKNQRLGDVVAGTLVVRDRRPTTDSAPLVGVRLGRARTGYTGWDVSGVTAEEVAAVRQFMAGRLRQKVPGVPRELGSEDFLEQLVLAKSQRA